MSPYSNADFALEFLYNRCQRCTYTHFRRKHLSFVPNNQHNIASPFNGKFTYKYLSKLIPKAGYCSPIVDYLWNGNQTNSSETEYKEPAVSHWLPLIISICTLTDYSGNEDENLMDWNQTLNTDFP